MSEVPDCSQDIHKGSVIGRYKHKKHCTVGIPSAYVAFELFSNVPTVADRQ